MKELYTLPPDLETRWTSPENFEGARGGGGQCLRGRKGSPNFPLESGGRRVLAEVEGRSGCLRRIWATFENRSPEVLRGLRLEIYWDGASDPAVSVPWGDFFGHVVGKMTRFESEFFSSPEGRSFNCILPMPFRSGMRVELINESSIDLQSVFFDLNYTLGDIHDADTTYLHSIWRRENPTALGEDFSFVPRLEGSGRFLGVHVGVLADRERYGDAWWGEGECKVYLDGDQQWPTLAGTGTEDYIGTAWGQGCFANRYQGSQLVDATSGCFGFYRWHVPDPIYFRKEIRVTMQQIGFLGRKAIDFFIEKKSELYSIYDPEFPVDLKRLKREDGVTLFERQDDWSACSFFYLDRPVNGLPPLQPVEERVANLPSADASATKRMDA